MENIDLSVIKEDSKEKVQNQMKKFKPKKVYYNMKQSEIYTKTKKLSLDNSTLKATSNNII